LIYRRLCRETRVGANLYAHPYSSKFPPLTSQLGEKVGASLPEHRGNSAGIGGKLQFGAPRIDDVNPRGKGARQLPPNEDRQGVLAPASRLPFGEGRIGGEDLLEWHHRFAPDMLEYF